MTRTKVVYLVGKSENQLYAYDEYDSGSGTWFTDNPVMAEEYNCERACGVAAKNGWNVYLWEIDYDVTEKKIVKEEIGLQFTNQRAIEKNEEFNRNAEQLTTDH